MRRVDVGHYEAVRSTYSLIDDVLKTGRISYGPKCKYIEEKFTDVHDCNFGVLSASGTDSLRAALHAMKIIHGWNDGDEVITAATTFVATVNTILQVGLTPVLVDVLPTHYTIDPSLITKKITRRTRAIVPVNLLGQAANLSLVSEIASDYDLKVVEDSCEAMFVTHRGRKVGSWGDIGCFSFYMAHLVTAGVGGIAITDNGEYADVMRSLLNHGRDTVYTSIDDDNDLYDDELDDVVNRRFVFLYPGYSSRMTELQAAIAMPQLDFYAPMIRKRQEIAEKLTARLSRHSKKLELPYPMKGNTHSWMMYGMSVTDGDKGPLVRTLERNNIETRDLLPLLDQPVYDGMFGYNYPVSQRALTSAFYIGCHQGITDDDVEYVGEVIDYFYGG